MLNHRKVKLILPGLLIALLFSCSTDRKLDLRSQLDSVLSALPGQHAVAFIDLSDVDSLMIHPDAVFHAASTMKTPVMVEVFRQAAAGKFSLNDSIRIINTFHSIIDSSAYSLNRTDDSDTAIYDRIGKMTTRRELVYRMMTISSNLATNILIAEVGASSVEKMLRGFGLNNMHVLRGVEDGVAFRAGKNNVTTARDQALLYQQLANGSIADSVTSREMIDILLEQKLNDKIPAELPSDVRVAHKTGSITSVHHDGGIVYLPDGRAYVLVILTKGWEDEQAALRTIAKASSVVYEYVVRKGSNKAPKIN